MKIDIRALLATMHKVLEKILHPKFFWLIILGLVLVSSLAVWAFSRPVRAATLFFPDARTHKLVATLRFIPKQAVLEEEIRAVLDELFLGPTGGRLLPITMPQVNVNTVIRSGKTVYIDISSDILFGKQTGNGTYGAPGSPYAEVLVVARKVMARNYPSLTAVFTINGFQDELNSLPATKINNLIDKGTTMTIINIKFGIMNAHYERST